MFGWSIGDTIREGSNIDECNFLEAVFLGDVKSLQWLRDNDCPWDESSFLNAVKSGKNIKSAGTNGFSCCGAAKDY
jgi:hypothetical protein